MIIWNNVHEMKVHVCINSAGLISTIWARGLMHLLRLLAAMSSVDAGWTRPIISLAVAENNTIANNPTTTTTTNHCYHYLKNKTYLAALLKQGQLDRLIKRRLRKTAQGADRYGNNRPSFKPKYTQLHNHAAYKLISVRAALHKSVRCHLPAPHLTNATAHKHTVHTPLLCIRLT